MNKHKINGEKGFALLFVIMMLLILSATVLTISIGLRTQGNTAAMTDNSSVALNHAENGLAFGYRKAFTNVAANSGFPNGTITLNDNGWTVRVIFSGTPGGSPPATIRSIATLGNLSRTVMAEFAGAVNPLNQFSFASGGTMNITNGSYDLNGNDLYAATKINIDSSAGAIHSSLPGATLNSPGSVVYPSWAQMQNISSNSGVPPVPIPGVNWSQFAANAWKTYNNVSSDLDISQDVINANGGIIVVRVTSGSPKIYTTSKNFTGSKATIVVIKDNASATPTVEIRNGTYGTQSNLIDLNVFCDGEIKSTSVSYYSKGVFYATGKVTIQNGTYSVTGGVCSQSDININSVNFSIFNPNWNNYSQYFSTKPGLANWREI